jgi:predicted PolB exonuclease-like 3'-5' exonuclease
MELFIDIETIARPGAEVLLPEVQAPANYKDPEKIAAYIAEARAKQAEKMALDVDCCEIVTIVSARDNHASRVWDVSKFESEAVMLQAFWGVIPIVFPLVGYNVGEFDLPILMRRSFLLGVKPSIAWEYRKYQKDNVLDLMQVLYNWSPPYRSLKHVCRLCGIPEPEGDGADVATMTPEQRIAHCKSDVEATRALYNKGKGYYW